MLQRQVNGQDNDCDWEISPLDFDFGSWMLAQASVIPKTGYTFVIICEWIGSSLAIDGGKESSTDIYKKVQDVEE